MEELTEVSKVFSQDTRSSRGVHGARTHGHVHNVENAIVQLPQEIVYEHPDEANGNHLVEYVQPSAPLTGGAPGVTNRQVGEKLADDVVSEMRDLKSDLVHIRELLGVLVRKERCAETKAEIAARRLDRMEREQHEADDAEHEANLQEALQNQSKAVKVLVDKWFVDKGCGFGRAPTGEIVFIHASAVQGAEVLTIGTDAWV